MDDHDAPATKGDLVELDAPMTERHEQLRCEMSHGYGNVVKRISDSETRLLQAFYSFAELNDKRMTQTDANVACS